MKWVLIGDDGQHDEEIYGNFVTSHPDHVVAVCIRQLESGPGDAGRNAVRRMARPPDRPFPGCMPQTAPFSSRS